MKKPKYGYCDSAPEMEKEIAALRIIREDILNLTDSYILLINSSETNLHRPYLSGLGLYHILAETNGSIMVISHNGKIVTDRQEFLELLKEWKSIG